LIPVKIVRTSVALAMIMSFLTTALSSPFEMAQTSEGRPFSEAEMGPPLDLIPSMLGEGGPRIEYGTEGDWRPPGGPFRAEGVALERGETYFLHIWLIDTKQIPPAFARSLLKENRSLDEIREEIARSEGNTTIRGGMILGDNRYVLANINQTFAGNCSVLEADLVEFDHMMRIAEDRVTGHIVIETREVDGAQVGEGNLTLNVDGETMSYRLTFSNPTPETSQNGNPSGGDPCPW
jgi:hypothetical protein